MLLSFILFTIVGTLSHELGHAVVAEYLGYDAEVSYGSTSYNPKGFLTDEDVKQIKKLTKDYLEIDYNEWPEDLKYKVERLDEKIVTKYPYNKSHDLWIAIGGPAQTILTSIIGLVILYLRRERLKISFKIIDWLAVFLSLFILRLVFNFITALYSTLMYSTSNFDGDEFNISRLMGYNEWLVPSMAMIFGLIIVLIVVFRFIPLKYRFTFIVSGLIGGILGYIIWFGFLGAALFNSNISF